MTAAAGAWLERAEVVPPWRGRRRREPRAQQLEPGMRLVTLDEGLEPPPPFRIEAQYMVVEREVERRERQRSRRRRRQPLDARGERVGEGAETPPAPTR